MWERLRLIKGYGKFREVTIPGNMKIPNCFAVEVATICTNVCGKGRLEGSGGQNTIEIHFL
jgi:hypothetical protein